MYVIKPALHHVTLKTSRLDNMIKWYGVVVGAEVQFRDDSVAWITNDAANHRQAFLSAPGLRDDPEKLSHNGIHHIAYEYASFADLMSSYERLRAEGIVPRFCLDHGLTTSIYYQDPDGNFVELQCDGFGDWRASGEWMRTSPDFAANPIGVFFDPEKVLAFFRTGMPYTTVQKAIRANDFRPDPVPGIGLPD
jgi:catechol 2,3-dioxygenase